MCPCVWSCVTLKQSQGECSAAESLRTYWYLTSTLAKSKVLVANGRPAVATVTYKGHITAELVSLGWWVLLGAQLREQAYHQPDHCHFSRVAKNMVSLKVSCTFVLLYTFCAWRQKVWKEMLVPLLKKFLLKWEFYGHFQSKTCFGDDGF